LTGTHIMTSLGKDAIDKMLTTEVECVYTNIKRTAQEFNTRGDLFYGANILGFFRVANAIMAYRAV